MRVPTHPGKRVTPAEIEILNAEQRTKSAARKAELEAALKEHFAEVATGIPKHHGCRKVAPTVKATPVLPEPKPESRADRVARAALRVKQLLGR